MIDKSVGDAIIPIRFVYKKEKKEGIMELDIKKKLVNVFFILAILSFIVAGGYITSRKDFVAGSPSESKAQNQSVVFLNDALQEECVEEAVSQYIAQGNKVEDFKIVEDKSDSTYYYSIALDPTLDQESLEIEHSELDEIINKNCR